MADTRNDLGLSTWKRGLIGQTSKPGKFSRGCHDRSSEITLIISILSTEINVILSIV